MRNRFILVLTVLSLVLAACGSDAEEATTTTAGGDTTETTAADGGDVGAQTGESTLDAVIGRGELNCGVNEELPGFGVRGSDGELSGFDIDFCRAIAAAVLGDADAVRFEALTAAQRFEAINSGLIDVLSRNTTWTQSRDTALGADFGPTVYYDGQQVMAKISEGFSGSSSLSDLEGAVVCVGAGTTTEK